MNAVATPKGVFNRARRDFAFDLCAVAQENVTANVGGLNARVHFFNDSTVGRSIAIYAFCALSQSVPNECGVQLIQAIDAASPSAGQMLNPSNGIIEGRISSDASTVASTLAIMTFIADGAWISWGEAPMFVLPPKWRFTIWNMTTSAGLDASILYGIY